MPKTKFFRVAVEGATVDGRTIDGDMIQQMADTYNTQTYTARINCEHLRGYSPDKPFNSYGSVAAVKAEKIELSIGGKTEKRLALFASFDVNDQAKEINKAGQKLFSSIEIVPNFAGTNKAYLYGVALTDSPASLGTELLEFSRDAKRKDNILYTEEITLEFAEDGAANDADAEVTSFISGLKTFFTGLSAPKQEDPAPKPEEKPAQASADMTSFAAMMVEFTEKLGAAFKAHSDATSTALAGFRTEIKSLKDDLEAAPARSYSRRGPSAGADDRARADC